jgi:hypothetical protein
MGTKKDGTEIKDNVKIVLRGPDGNSVHELSMVAEKDAPGTGDILKIHKKGVNYVVAMVEVNDANASRLRIRTTTGTKAIRLKT